MKVFTATGRRKTSVAQVQLISPGTGKITINKQAFEQYFPIEFQRIETLKPLELTKFSGKVDISANVHGGGKSGQFGALQLGISRALIQLDESMRSQLRAAGLLTRDPRMVERKKYGQKKARKRFQFSKR